MIDPMQQLESELAAMKPSAVPTDVAASIESRYCIATHVVGRLVSCLCYERGSISRLRDHRASDRRAGCSRAAIVGNCQCPDATIWGCFCCVCRKCW